jgi:hemin uptake protein HemP
MLSAEQDPSYAPRPVDPAGADLTTPDSNPMHDATALTAGGRTARIHLNGQIYALRITRQGKLILTK